MVRTLIQVDSQLSDEFSNAFPTMVARPHHESTTLVGKLADQQELQGVLNLLDSLGVEILMIVNIPDD